MLWGACAFAYFKMNEPGPTLLLEDGTIDSLAAMPAMLNEILPFGLKGLMLAAGLAAMMSTFDSYLLCWSSTIVNDILDPLSNYQMSDKQKISITRLCVVDCGLFALFWSYFYTPADTMLRFISITGTMFFAGMLGAIALGLYWPKTNSVGAATAIILGCIPPLVTVFLQGSPNIPEYRQWLVDDKTTGITAFVLAVGGSILGSLLTQKIVPPKQLEPIDA